MIEEVKKRLKGYSKSNVKFSNHATQMIILREGNKSEVINELLNPVNLIDAFPEDNKTVLIFRLSGTRTLKLPVIFNKGGRKCLYIVTYIKRYRPWQRIVKEDVQ